MCPIPLTEWFAKYAAMVSLKLALTVARFLSIKHSRKENIGLYLVDLIVMNLLFAYLFIDANIIYLSS